MSCKCAIIIPVYKSTPGESERISFGQCLKVFKNRKIYLAIPENLNVAYYHTMAKKHGIRLTNIYFSDSYFKSISGYTKLLLNKKFYLSFSDYTYILIYQLDAYAFSDELDFWCNKDYDYIGAPWFEKYGSHEAGNKLWKVGNGGFSLRKVSTFIHILSEKRPLLRIKELKKKYRDTFHTSFLKKQILFFLTALGYKNTISYFIKNNYQPEDIFYMDLQEKSYIKLNLPTAEESIKFAFEQSPAYLYKLNNFTLPFGCHAWEKYDAEFWKPFIINSL